MRSSALGAVLLVGIAAKAQPPAAPHVEFGVSRSNSATAPISRPALARRLAASRCATRQWRTWSAARL